MATDASIVTKDWEPAARAFVQQANAEQLVQMAAGTALASHPLLSNPPGASEQPREALRKLIAHNVKRHADFRGLVIRRLAQAGLITAPAKEAKKEAPAAAGKEPTGAKERKPKKEKGGEQPPSQPHKPGPSAEQPSP